MGPKVLSGFAVLVLMVVGLIPAASADKKSEPAETGVVERFDTLGGHVVGPVLVDVDGTERAMLLAVGWDSVEAFCSGPPNVPNGVEQDVFSPSGNFTGVVHNADIPVLLFDVSAFASEDDFLAACFAGDVEAFATGPMKQRPILVGNPSGFSIKVSSHGTLSGPSGDWAVNAFLKVVFGDGPDPESVRESLKIRRV